MGSLDRSKTPSLRPQQEDQKQPAASKKTEEGQQMTRRRALKLLLALAGGSYGVYKLNEHLDDVENDRVRRQQRSSQRAEESAVESNLDRRIDEIERGFQGFERRIMPLIEGMNPDPVLIRSLLNPFEIARMNLSNDRRNWNRLERETRNVDGQPQNALTLDNPYHFMYRFIGSDDPDMYFGYSGAEGTMSINAQYDPENFFDNLALYHEMFHVGQAANTRTAIGTGEPYSFPTYENYSAFYTTHSREERPRYVLVEEASAYAFEIEVLNLELAGSLKQSILDGEEINVEELSQRLHLRDDQVGNFNDIIGCAQAYYSDGGLTDGNLPTGLLDAVYQRYLSQYNMEGYTWTTGGYLRPYR